MDDDRIDLSALDPARDRARWNALVAGVAARAAARRRAPLSRVLAGYAIPAFTLAAAATLAIWLFAPPRGAPATVGESAGDLSGEMSGELDGLAGWGLRGVADGAGLLRSLGGGS